MSAISSVDQTDNQLYLNGLIECYTGGTGKDRAAKMMLLEAMDTGKLPMRNGIVVEGTSGRSERRACLNGAECSSVQGVFL